MPVRRLVLLSALALFASVPSGASAATCAGADTQISSATLDSSRDAVFCIVNAERAAHGLPSVAPSDKLALAAQRHTDDMVARDFFSHYAPAPAPFGEDPGDRISAADYNWGAYGENIAAGYRTPRSVMLGWMASEGHCTNILDPGFTQLGVGDATAAATIARGVGTWTQDFARPRGAAAPSSDRGPQQGCPYTGLQGIDALGTILSTVLDPSSPEHTSGDTPSSSGGDTPAGHTPSHGDTSADVPAGETPADPARLAVRLRHAGRGLTIAGTLAAADRTRVQVTVLRHGRAVGHGTGRLRHGRFTVRLRTPRGARRFTVVVSAAGQRVVRFVV
jgi:uncharacterized protein YkwD